MDELRTRLAIYCALGRDVRAFRRVMADHASAVGALGSATLRARARNGVTDAVWGEADRELERAATVGAWWTWPGEVRWPASLEITGAQLLCGVGPVPSSGLALGVVGSREADAYGREVGALLASACATAGVCVVSGGAEGVDEAAHRGALSAGGSTGVLLGTGLGAGLRREVARAVADAGGWVASELLFDAAGAAWTFPDRNRLIAALSSAVVVVQAGRKSGTLHTARFAREYGRPVFAVLGDLGMPQTEGVLDLLAEGHARVLRHPLDLEEALGVRGFRSVAWPAGRTRAPVTMTALPASGAEAEPAATEWPLIVRSVVEVLDARGPMAPEVLSAALGGGSELAVLEAELCGAIMRDAQGLYRVCRGVARGAVG